METTAIQRQYDCVIADQYDQDPLYVTGSSLDRAMSQLQNEELLIELLPALRVLDIGMGTGMFLQKLRSHSARRIVPHGIDISHRMLEIAQQKLPDLTAAVDDGANIDQHFCDEFFDLVSTHFVTGFVPIEHLAPRIHHKLNQGGCWSFVGGTSEGYDELQRRASNPLVRLMFGGRTPSVQGMICPENEQAVVRVMQQSGFEILAAETYEPELRFADFDAFMQYAYHGGWLTPFIEEIGLHRIRPWQKLVLNKIIFPVVDHHRIVLVLARKC